MPNLPEMKGKAARDMEKNETAKDEGLANPKTKNEETLAEGYAERSSEAAMPVRASV